MHGMKLITSAVVAAGLLLAAGPASSHHSFAMFERDKIVMLSGQVKEFQWTNPHSWIQVMATDAKGAQKEWSIECGSPNMMSRQGWKSGTLKPGDKVNLMMRPMRDGSP